MYVPRIVPRSYMKERITLGFEVHSAALKSLGAASNLALLLYTECGVRHVSKAQSYSAVLESCWMWRRCVCGYATAKALGRRARKLTLFLHCCAALLLVQYSIGSC